MTEVEKFEHFLESVELSAHRNTYAPIKIVEMDMPRDIQALDLLYKTYWDKKRFISYSQFYKEYEDKYRIPLEEFRKKVQMCETCFYHGLPARIYRTWASIITQIHAGYVAETVFGSGSVEMSSGLDHQGADFRVTYNGIKINYQVKKISFSREKRQEKQVRKKQLDGEFVPIEYEVPNFDIIINPRKLNGQYKKSYSRFAEKWLDTGKLKVLSNGFVIFTSKIFIDKKHSLVKK